MEEKQSAQYRESIAKSTGLLAAILVEKLLPLVPDDYSGFMLPRGFLSSTNMAQREFTLAINALKKHGAVQINGTRKPVVTVAPDFKDWAEGAIEGPAPLKEVKKEVTEEDKAVNQVLATFYECGAKGISFSNKMNRDSARELIRTLGFGTTVDLTMYAFEVSTEQYAPTCTSPKDLLEKHHKLISFRSKREGRKELIV